MKKISTNETLPKPKAGDVLDALEMLRATLCLLRNSFGIVCMAGNVAHGGSPFMTDTELKEFAVRFEDVSKDLKACHSYLIDVYSKLKQKES